MKKLSLYLFIFIITACENIPASKESQNVEVDKVVSTNTTSLVLLGTIQDAGSPHIACKKDC